MLIFEKLVICLKNKEIKSYFNGADCAGCRFNLCGCLLYFYGMRLGLKQSRCIMMRKGRLKNIQTAFFR
jgi:hypothetical protein